MPETAIGFSSVVTENLSPTARLENYSAELQMDQGQLSVQTHTEIADNVNVKQV